MIEVLLLRELEIDLTESTKLLLHRLYLEKMIECLVVGDGEVLELGEHGQGGTLLLTDVCSV